MSNMLDQMIEILIYEVCQSSDNPLAFHFYVMRGHPHSEEIAKWFKDNGTIFEIEKEYDDWPSIARVDFSTKPDLAVLFKLAFVRG